MILVGENINLMAPTVGEALRNRAGDVIQEIARAETAAGMDYINANTGPARREGSAMMQWLVDTVQSATPLPLALDTTSLEAMEAGLKAYRNPRPALINSISLARLEEELPLMTRFPAEMVGLLWGPEGMPRDVNERCLFAVDLVYRANQAGVTSDRIWLDPIMTPVSVPGNQIMACLEFMSMVPEIAPGCKSIIGLSNISSGTPRPLRPYLNRTFLIMMQRHGLYAAIVDAYDATLRQIARGELPEITSLVHRIMDGESLDTTALPVEMQKYVKTARVLLGQAVYSHAWLEA